jgi:hypothetical protein
MFLERSLFRRLYRRLTCHDGVHFCGCNSLLQLTRYSLGQPDEIGYVHGPYFSTTFSRNSASTEYTMKSEDRDTAWPSGIGLIFGIPMTVFKKSELGKRTWNSDLQNRSSTPRTFQVNRRHESWPTGVRINCLFHCLNLLLPSSGAQLMGVHPTHGAHTDQANRWLTFNR